MCYVIIFYDATCVASSNNRVRNIQWRVCRLRYCSTQTFFIKLKNVMQKQQMI